MGVEELRTPKEVGVCDRCHSQLQWRPGGCGRVARRLDSFGFLSEYQTPDQPVGRTTKGRVPRIGRFVKGIRTGTKQ